MIGYATCLISILFPGFFIEVNNEKLVVRMGLVKLNVFSMPLKDIQSAEIVTFRPLRDFGGWGIRYGKDNAWAYFMSGTQGVKIVTTKNRKYIIGSDTPDLLNKVIQAKCHFDQTND
ncbi:MAG: hypothetical protein ACRC10_08230 [Thermoguttaceae bacterium]